jgi:hypothetical protein
VVVPSRCRTLVLDGSEASLTVHTLRGYVAPLRSRPTDRSILREAMNKPVMEMVQRGEPRSGLWLKGWSVLFSHQTPGVIFRAP